jgi:hypothetical protein
MTVKYGKMGEHSSYTLNARRAEKLIDQIDLEVGHIDTLKVVQLFAPRCIGSTMVATQKPKHALAASNHELGLVVLGLANTVEHFAGGRTDMLISVIVGLRAFGANRARSRTRPRR